MSAMKPDGYAVQMDSGNFVGIWREKAVAESVCSKQPASHNDTVEPLYTLTTVRKWLEEPPSKEMLESVFQLKANDPDKQDMADLMTRVVHFDICERMLAAKLRELEDGK